jgi:hypothetical protein
MTAIALRLPSTTQFDAGGIFRYLLGEVSDPAACASEACSRALDLHRSQTLRTIILRGLDAGAPLGASDSMLLCVAQAIYPNAGAPELRRELDRMEFEALIAPSGSIDDARWYELSERGMALAVTYRPEARHH